MSKCGQCGAQQDEWSVWHGGALERLEAENQRLREAHEQTIVDYNEQRDWPAVAAMIMYQRSADALKGE